MYGHVVLMLFFFQKKSVCDLETVSTVDEAMVGRYVVVLYDKKPFPGVIQAADEDDIEVKVKK